jgi:hypothetical protein
MSRVASSLSLTVFVAAAIVSARTAAFANLPDPGECTFDDHLGRSPRNAAVSPAHQYTYHGTLRNSLGEPIANYPAFQIELTIFSPCQNPAVLNPDGPTNAQGQLVFGPETLAQGGGSCSGPQVVEVTVAGLLFETLDSVTSPDEDGDGLIAVNDLQTWQQAFTGQSPLYQGDLDFDGAIALTDLVRWQAHFTAP